MQFCIVNNYKDLYLKELPRFSGTTPYAIPGENKPVREYTGIDREPDEYTPENFDEYSQNSGIRIKVKGILKHFPFTKGELLPGQQHYHGDDGDDTKASDLYKEQNNYMTEGAPVAGGINYGQSRNADGGGCSKKCCDIIRPGPVGR